MNSEEIEKERESARKGFKKVADLFSDWVEEKIQLSSEESETGLVFKLRTKSCLEGVKPDDFAQPEKRIRFSTTEDKPALFYKKTRVATPDFYLACEWLLQELERKEKQSHHRELLGQAEISIERYLRSRRCASHFPRVYALCAKHFQNLPAFEELDEKDLPKVLKKLTDEEVKLKIGGIYQVLGIGILKSIQWDENRTLTFALDPCEVYQTGHPESMQFREDLERYAKLADKNKS